MILINRNSIISLLISLTLAGCSQPAVTKISPTLTPNLPISTQAVYNATTSLTVKSVVMPLEPEAELAFITSGYVESVNVRIGDNVKSGDTLVQLDTVILEAELAHAESSVKAAKAEYEYQKKLAEASRLTSDALLLQSSVELAAAKLAFAESGLVLAQNLLKQATMTAPFDGTILDVQVVPGETVTNGKTVVKMVALQNLQVETIDLNEIDIPHIYIDQPVSVYIYALNTNFEGVVIKIAPQATLIGENRVYKVTIQLNDQPENLRWGMSAETKFTIDR